MIEKILVLFMYLFSIFGATTVFACPMATPTTSAEFCQSFKVAAQCHCSSSGLPARMCQDMNIIYERMLAVFRDVKKACEFQHDTSVQNCIDSWHCYRDGGLNSNNELCSGTGSSCA